MKKIFSGILLLSMFMCSCIMSDEQIFNKTFDKVIESLQNKDKEKLKSLFSKNAIEQDGNFEEDLEALFEYFEGENPEYEEGPCYSEKSRDEDMEIKLLGNSCEVITNCGNYWFCMYIVVTDDYNPDNVGICSLYIIKSEDYKDKEYYYWGDGGNTPGINIGIQ